MRQLMLVILMCCSLGSVASAEPEVNDASTKELRDLYSDVEKELYSRGYSTQTREGRIEKAESNLKKIVNRGSWKNAVIGSVLTAAVTAHPAGLVIGGLAGSMVGKSKNYEKAEEEFAAIEHEIIVDEDDFLTEGEIRLAKFAGEEMNPVAPEELDDSFSEADQLALAGSQTEDFADSSEEVFNEGELDVIDFDRSSNAPNATQQPREMPMINVAEGPSAVPPPSRAYQSNNGVANQQRSGRVELESCYGRDAEAAARKRQRLPHCFYMMY